MNEERQRILDIFDKNVELKDTVNREKQEQIKELIVENIKLEELKNENEK